MTGVLPIMPKVLELDAEAWALRISARWRASTDAIIEVGQLLIDAKGRLPHGEFGAMLETALPFSTSTAQRLMAIAADKRLSNPAHVQYLPPYWGTLYEITKLSDHEFDHGIENGIIRPDMERKAIELIRLAPQRSPRGIESSDGAGESRPRLETDVGPGEIRSSSRSVNAEAGIAPGPSEAISALPRDENGSLTPEAKAAIAPLIKEIRAEKIEAKKERRAEREAGWGTQVQALPDKMYGIAIEDFEWDHEAWSSDTGTDRHPSMHYQTATDAHTPEEIVARCAERFQCLADDCVLFKWSTIPHLAIALRVLELQGFRYVTHLIWDKERPGNARGPGYWFTGEHEIVLVGTRGKVVPPATAHFRSRFAAPVGAHSQKPPNIHEIVEYHWPSVPRIEFNARRTRAGWDSWGNEAQAAPNSAEAAE